MLRLYKTSTASLSETTLSLTYYKTISYLLRIENIAEFHILVHSINYHVDCTWKYIYIYVYMYTCCVQYIELHFLIRNGCSIHRKASCVAEVHTGNITALAVSYAVVTKVTVSEVNPSIRCVDGLNSEVPF